MFDNKLCVKKFFSFFFISATLFSQDYRSGLLCFLEKDYLCSRNHFHDFIILNNDLNTIKMEYAHYYLFMSALKSYNHDTEYLFDKFIIDFPLSNKKTDAIFFMSEYYFEKKKYKEVVSLLSELNLYQLSGPQKDAAFFYLGYSSYILGDYELAKNSFYEAIIDFESVFNEDAIFYNSYILLLNSDLESALNGFNSIKKSNKYSKDIPYFISSILFDLGEYEKIVDYLEPLLIPDLLNYYDHLVLLLAKSLYHLEEYDLSIVYFEEYKELKVVLSRDQLYQMGFAYYKKGLYGFAINHLNKILVEENDITTQYAFYYLGDSYLKTENRIEAMNAFRSASLINMDSLIQHDAFYQFAILCYEQKSPLYSPIHYLSKFIEKYPNSEYVNEIFSCLANIHLNNNNYDEAIKILEKSRFLDLDVKHQYQKICFHRGVQLYNDGFYEESIIYFNKSLSMGLINNLLFQTHYWKAESYYNLNMFENAIDSYNKLNTKSNFLYSQSLYSKAYSYLKIEDYNNSIETFRLAVKYNTDSNILYDIYMRMGDSYFSIMDYDESINFYDKALLVSGLEDDYACYKKSTSYALLGDYSNSIQSFNYLINNFLNSNYLDDAIFDLGNVYILSRNFDLSVESFLEIIKSFPKSLFYPKSKLKLGLVYYMQEKDQDAVEILQNVLFEFPNSNISNEALVIIKNIYSEKGEANKFIDLIQSVDHDYTKAELDSSMYYSSELQYMQENFQSSINSFKSYLTYYPNGLFTLDANYYLYKSYEQIGDLEKAIEFLNNIVTETENKYTVEGLLSLARISYELNKYISSELYFTKLLNSASEIDIKREASLGLLESKFHLYKYDDVINDLSNIIDESLFSGKEEVRLHYIKAYSFYKLNRNKESLIEFSWLTDNTEGELKAESFFYTALLLYNNKKYEESQKIIFQLINELPAYQFWVQKSLLLLSKNYIMQEDMFQAQHVLIELQKKCQNEDILHDLIQIIESNFPNLKSDSIPQLND